MGYFNIFYKITRIIDMLTRKRNRKAIMVILIIIAMVFLFSTKVNAAEPVYENIITDFYRLRADVNNTTGQLTYYNVLTGSSKAAHCLLQPVFAGYHYQFYWNSGHALYFYYIDNVNNLDSYFAAADTSNFNTNTLPLITLVPSSNNTFTYTCDKDGYVLISNFKDDANITSWNSYDIRCSTDYDGTSNLTSIHNDLTRIEDLLKDYLYGDAVEYQISKTGTNSSNGFQINSSSIVVSSNQHAFYYFKVKKNYTYTMYFKKNGEENVAVRFGYTDSIPVDGSQAYNVTLFDHYNEGKPSSYTFTALQDGYFCYGALWNRLELVKVMSNYNPGQEQGLYGGLTDIDSQVQTQGQNINDSITSTDYNQSDVNINTDSVSNIDTSQTDGLFTTIFNNFNSAATGGVDSITIPLPHNSGNIVLYSNVVSSHLGNLSALVSAFWYFVFGLYAFKFVNNLLHSIKDGSILNGFRNNNEVITSDML